MPARTRADHSERAASAARTGATRRQFLLGGAAAGAGAVAALAVEAAVAHATEPAPASVPLNGDQTVPFHGAHQAGIDTDAQAHAQFVAFDLRPEVGRDDLRRLMRLLSDDAARLTQGRAALADSEPELAVAPARLTVTFGFGPGFVARAEQSGPSWLAPLPAFTIDRLQPEFSDGDLLVQIASDDPLSVAHATRMIVKDARSFATVRWIQQGFRRAHGSVKPGTTMRNLFGQVDGTTNPEPGTPDFDTVVWADAAGWLTGGTGMVVRRIAMNLDAWDEIDRVGRDQFLGRTQANGAPLTGTDEFDEPDFDATSELGVPIIPVFSHVRRSHSPHAHERIFRRAYNYDHGQDATGATDAGLVFVSFQADVERQFTPIQRRLDELDMLNQWTTPIGSAVFAIPPGCGEGGYIGETLLE